MTLLHNALCKMAATFHIYLISCQQGQTNTPDPVATSLSSSIVSASRASTSSAAAASSSSLAALSSSLASRSSSSSFGSVSATISSGSSSAISITSSVSSAVSSTSSEQEESISLTETAPEVTTVTGSTSAAPPPATATSDGAATSAAPANTTVPVAPALAATVDSKILILVRVGDSSYSVVSGLQGYGIPYEVVEVPKTGFQLPTLSSSKSQGNYGGIISLSELAYEYDGGVWNSGISNDQYKTIYDYQSAFGVRFVRIDAYPQPAFGTSPADQGVGCCGNDVEQLISLTNSTGYESANIKTDATMSTKNMYHYPAKIIDDATTWQVAKYAPSGIFDTDTTAAVVNNFAGREQMVWFGSWATEWSPTSISTPTSTG
jgi:hypothetical protein